jgi:3-methyladenine DNA glycosylase AlkD
MDIWIDDEDIWVARTAILHQLRYKDALDQERLFGYVEKRAADTEFFIRKALGSPLRDYAHVAPDAVRDFVCEHEDELSGLTRREALKHLKYGDSSGLCRSTRHRFVQYGSFAQ